MCDFKVSEQPSYKVGRVRLAAGEKQHLSVTYPAIFFNTETNINIATGFSEEEKKIAKGQLFLLPPDMVCTLISETACDIIYLEISDILLLYTQFFSCLYRRKKIEANQFLSTLDILGIMNDFVCCLSFYAEENISVPAMLELKATELMFLLKHYHTAENIRRFFAPALSDDYKFALFVWSHYQQVSSSKELADLSDYSFPNFEKMFRKLFDQPPYQWMLEQKARNIHRELKNTSKPIKVIADEYGFPSISNFGDFCRKHLGEAPSYIRKRMEQE